MIKRLTCLIFFLPAAVFSQDQYLVDWDEVGEESINHLIELVRINTSNPPGNETEAANYVRTALAQRESIQKCSRSIQIAPISSPVLKVTAPGALS